MEEILSRIETLCGMIRDYSEQYNASSEVLRQEAIQDLKDAAESLYTNYGSY